MYTLLYRAFLMVKMSHSANQFDECHCTTDTVHAVTGAASCLESPDSCAAVGNRDQLRFRFRSVTNESPKVSWPLGRIRICLCRLIICSLRHSNRNKLKKTWLSFKLTGPRHGIINYQRTVPVFLRGHAIDHTKISTMLLTIFPK